MSLLCCDIIDASMFILWKIVNISRRSDVVLDSVL